MCVYTCCNYISRLYCSYSLNYTDEKSLRSGSVVGGEARPRYSIDITGK